MKKDVLPKKSDGIKRILVIGESDSLGATGIQGDTKTIMALGGHAMTAITALTTHKAHEILSIKDITPALVVEQIKSVLQDVRVDGVKIGFLRNKEVIKLVAHVLEDLKAHKIPVVVDPCIVSRSGKLLMDNEDIAALKRDIYIHTTALTPNLTEAEALGVMNILHIDDMRHAADMMRTLGVENVVLKGRQLEGDRELYFVAAVDGERIFEQETVKTPHTLGAGNVLSSSLTVYLARGMNIFDAFSEALTFLHQTMINTDGFGMEIGPVNLSFSTGAIKEKPSLTNLSRVAS